MSRLMRFISARWTRRRGAAAAAAGCGGGVVPRVSADTGRLRCHVALLDGTDLLVDLPVSSCTCRISHGWRRGGVVSGVRRMNEVNPRRARLVPGWVTVFGRVYHLHM